MRLGQGVEVVAEFMKRYSLWVTDRTGWMNKHGGNKM